MSSMVRRSSTRTRGIPRTQIVQGQSKPGKKKGAEKTLPEKRPPKKKGAEKNGTKPPPATHLGYSDVTDPQQVDHPVLDLIHPSLRHAWEVNKHRQMCLIFDCVNPVRQFKRGTVYDESDDHPFPRYSPSPEEDGNVTETDEAGGTQPYNPIAVTECVLLCQYRSLLLLILVLLTTVV
jgi:hypothetical protein